MTTCPTCGQEVSDLAAVVVSLDDNTLSYHGKTIRLTATQAEVASILAKRAGHTVLRDRFVAQVWGTAEPDCARQSLDVHISALRRLLKPIGLNIFTTWGRGYRLDVA